MLNSPAPIRILLADDHALVRAGIRSLLEKIPGVVVVGEAGTGREALEQVPMTQPELVLMDIAMSDLNGLEATERMVRQHPGIRVLILSMHSNEEYILRARQVGAAGYILKNAASSELERAIRAVQRGEYYLSPAVSRQLAQTSGGKGSEPMADSFALLTSRQREVLQMIAEGKNTKEIAFILNVSTKTVESHRALLMDRLGIHDVPGLVRYAIRKGLVTSDT